MSELNTTGIKPMEYNVLVRLDRVEQRRGSIYMPDSKTERDQTMQTRGQIVDASPLAFGYDNWPQDAQIPKSGDHIIIAKGAGVLIDDVDDGHIYRLVKDKDVAALIVKQVAAVAAE